MFTTRVSQTSRKPASAGFLQDEERSELGVWSTSPPGLHELASPLRWNTRFSERTSMERNRAGRRRMLGSGRLRLALPALVLVPELVGLLCGEIIVRCGDANTREVTNDPHAERLLLSCISCARHRHKSSHAQRDHHAEHGYQSEHNPLPLKMGRCRLPVTTSSCRGGIVRSHPCTPRS